jgi:hypothetical protein
VLAIIFLKKATAANKSYLIILWSISLAGFWHTIQLGQIYTILFLALTLTLLFEKRGSYLIAGILAGFIVALKPNFLIWILLLAANRKWKIAIPASISFVALSAIPAIIFGPEIYLQWINASSLDERILGLPGNNSLPGLTTRLGFTEIGFYLGGLLVVMYSILIFNKRGVLKDNEVYELGIILSLLCSPISWTGYTILLVPAYFYRKDWSLISILSASILVVPFVFPLFLFDNSQQNFVFWGWFYGWAILLQFVQTSRESGLFQKTQKEGFIE